MPIKKKKPKRLTRALLETAAGMRKSGLFDGPTYDKITLRHLDPAGRKFAPSGSALK
jgi:hypothetical protein